MDNDDDKTFYANAYFDDVIVFVPMPVFTSQDKFKPFSCAECGKELYESKTKSNKKGFISTVNSELKKITREPWPYKNDLFVQISVSDLESSIKKVDIDNLIKTIFDSIKGIVFNDDSQVVSVYANKFYFEQLNLPSFVLGIRELQPKEMPIFQDSLWSVDEEYCIEEREYRLEINRPTGFFSFNLSQDKQFVPDHILRKSRLL